MKIYLDNAATTPLDKEVLEAMLPYMTEKYGNPSASHSMGRESRSAIEKARKVIASYVNASPAEIFFTSGGTESNNMAIRCAVRDLGIKHIISSPLEHHCVLHTVEEMDQAKKATLHNAALLPDGHIDLDALDRQLEEIGERCLVTLMHANNEIGNLLNIKKVFKICEKHNAVFHSDTVQTIGHYRINLAETKVHFLSGSGHKFHGPKGIGFIYINPEVTIKPLLYGGSQEVNMRAGTENLYGIVGLGKAIQLAYDNLEQDREHIIGIRTYMIEQLRRNFPDVAFNGDAEGKSLYTVLNVSFPPDERYLDLPISERNSMLLFSLDMEGICASSGSACTSGSQIGSHVLRAINVDPNRPSIRFSFSKYNTKEEIDTVLAKLKELLPVKANVN